MDVESDSFQPVLCKGPDLHVTFDAEHRPTNVRKAIIETALRVADAMLEADSDNTKAYNSIINVSIRFHCCFDILKIKQCSRSFVILYMFII